MSVRDGAIEELRAAVGLRIADEALLRSLVGGLGDVEDVLREVVRSDVEAINEAARHLVEAGGKRFRPMFTLLAAEFGSDDRGSRDAVVTAAAAVELVHLATLYHDDVMDEATMRRGALSVNARWDNTVAILTGDYLFAHASRLVADLGTDAARIIAETFGELVTGQMRETVGPGMGEDPVEHYLSVIGQKTGSLIATAGRFGGMLSGAAADHIEALHRFGEIIGTAFQISDDIIDIASPSSELGKSQGTDLREGVRTLPMLYALADERCDPRLAELLGGPITDDATVAEALELLRTSGGLDRAHVTLSDYARRARTELEALPSSPARDACESVTDYLVARTH
ncbi:geranylgeranyl pyrophosphate synthase [Saccharomonospora marina XMU15]|uniref:Geranylgeranyl pyrophosphate synthase n=1 Tax=Saccharomonospora marina XMU15 TaxID=882083 RepID=H5X570_9PSEU|nr:polyprenyl synthetase family protein [Saccharomonospora marina]EHR48881.1 geranylgeranyl pyrophosphate synthase [Saccharomonospora marina XMU15]